MNGVVMAAIADLVWEQADDTLAVADWKSDSGCAEELRTQYSSQLDAYAQLLESAAGLRAARRLVVAMVAVGASIKTVFGVTLREFVPMDRSERLP